MNHWGVSSCCTNPPVAMAHHRNDAGTPRNTTKSYPHPPEPPRPAGVTIVARRPRLPHTTSHNHCAQSGRNNIDIWLCTRPDIATVWTCPTPVYIHTAKPGTNNTHTARVIVLCALLRPTCPKGNAIKRNQTGMPPPQRKIVGTNPPCGEDTPDR